DEPETFFADRESAEREVREGLAKGKLSFELRGEKVKGSFALVRTAKDPKSWLLIKHKDRFDTADDITLRNRSVLGNASVAEMKSAPVRRIDAKQLVPTGRTTALPKLEPMHAALGDKAFNDKNWSWEPKLDGYRVLAYFEDDRVTLRSRR